MGEKTETGGSSPPPNTGSPTMESADQNNIKSTQQQQQQEQLAPTTDADSQEKFAKQKHAMDFLYKVRVQYAKNPSVYNQFLEIMKDFKSARYGLVYILYNKNRTIELTQHSNYIYIFYIFSYKYSIDTPEVIARVKELFKGNNFLIQEFNAFLPPGYKIEVDNEPYPPLIPNNNLSPPPPPMNTNNSAPNLAASQSTLQSNAAIANNGGGGFLSGSATDLEHARNYVRKIKASLIFHRSNIYSFIWEPF